MKLQIFVKKTTDYKSKEKYVASLCSTYDLYGDRTDNYDVLYFYGETEEEAIDNLKQGYIKELEKQNIKIIEVEV